MTGSRELQTKTEQLEKVNMQKTNADAANSRRITVAEKLLRIANHTLNLLVACLMTVLFLYGGYSLWDTWRIYHSARPDSSTSDGSDTPRAARRSDAATSQRGST